MLGIDKLVIIASTNAVSCDLAGESVILDMKTGKYFALDDIGTRVWQILRTPCTLKAICEDLMRDYDVSLERSEADVSALLHRLIDLGLAAYADESQAA